jgi:hypothetical protein
MALTLASPVVGQFHPDTRDIASPARKFALAVLGAGTQAQRATARNELLDRPDFVCTARTTDNTAASEVIDLTTEGVTFPASTIRKIRFRSVARTGADQFVQEWEQSVLGGTTPVLLGSPTLLHCSASLNGVGKQYGLCKLHYPVVDGALGTINALHSTAGMSLDGLDNGNGVITHPIARATNGARVVSALFSADVETIGERREVQVASQATATTSTLSMATQNGTEAVAVPTDDGELQVTMYILPPPSIALAVTSNNVEVHCGYDATDNVYHYVEVRVGRAEPAAVAVD